MKNITYLYFCDGKACKEEVKRCCFTNGDRCHHTPDVKHALSRIQENFPPTTFQPFGSTELMIERFCEDDIFECIKDGEHLILV